MEKNIGRILKGIGGFYYVEAADNVFECKARGVFRKMKISPLVGDVVEFSINENAENTIDVIYERKNTLIRPPLANIDQLMIVVATCYPVPSTLVIDKLTAIATHKNIEPIIIITKTDLQDAGDLPDIYKKSGFKTFCISPEEKSQIEEIKSLFEGKISAFTGNSGVGKSTLLNNIDERLGLSTGDISKKLGRGRHTTRHCELFKICGGYVADTPGFSSLDLEKCEVIMKDDLPESFIEFGDYINDCKFSSCAHVNDKGCAVLKAVEDGKIQKSRHESYVQMYNDVKDLREWKMK